MKANKKPSAFRLWLGRVVPISLISALTMAASCDKEPEPQPEPTKTIVIDWDWNVDTTWAPSMDSIKYYAKQPDVKDVYINMVNKQTEPTMADVTGSVCDGYLPKMFNTARDSLETRFKYSDKVKGSGTIFVSKLNGAQLPDVNSGLTGMAEVDSIWYAMHGFKIERWRGHSKKFNK